MPETIYEKRAGHKLTAEMLTKVGAPLDEIDWRILHWLLRYPLQRVDDLVVGVARWASRATVYRHLHGLEVSGLVESALPGTPGEGKRLYYLSNFGLHVLTRHLERPARVLARQWQTDEAGLLRFLPRLPTLLLLQGVVNGLVTGAAAAMSPQGRRPQLVRWTWQRDLTHRFLYREQLMRLFADGLVALCIRTQSDDTPSDRWYGVFLFFTQLEDERVMRLRLERLLCWRESPERWPVYQHMLPVLILAASPRQREHWQRAVEATALKLRLEPLVGALAALPPTERTRMNPWLLNWHTLATEESCQLQARLQQVPLAAFPTSLPLQADEDEHDGRPLSSESGTSAEKSSSTGTPTRLARLIVGNLERRAASILMNEPSEQEMVTLLGLRLSPGQWDTLHLLLAHPLLSDQELAALLALQRTSARTLLSSLRRLGCLHSIPTEAGTRWQLGERGLRLISASNHFHIRNLAVALSDEASSGATTMKQRGGDWLLEHIQHTAGIYRFFATLAEAARRAPGHALCWWETGAMCERRYRLSEQWHNLRPDALAAYRTGQQQRCFWLEWDRGTMNARDLAIKFASYAQYIDSREWAREWDTLPWLVCVAPEIAQERRVQRVAQDALSPFHGVVVWTTTEGLLSEHGPLTPIWSMGIPMSGQVETPNRFHRQHLFHLPLETTSPHPGIPSTNKV